MPFGGVQENYWVFMLDETLVNVFLSALPSPCIAAMAVTAISAPIGLYSIAVAARDSRSKVRKLLSISLGPEKKKGDGTVSPAARFRSVCRTKA